MALDKIQPTRLDKTATTWDFTGVTSITVPTPTLDAHASTKLYVDTAIGLNNDLSEILANGNTTGGNDIAISIGDAITFGAVTDQIGGIQNQNLLDKSAAETISGVFTYSAFPVTPSSAPTTDYQVANKKYVDDTTAIETLADTLSAGNVSSGTNLIMSVGDVLTTDTINETGVGTGVTIDSVLIKDNSVTATTFTGALVGNASTATALATARTIGGTSFDGTANIAIGALNSTNVGATTSLEFLGVISDETGTGKVTFATAPTFTTSITVTGGCTIDSGGINLANGNNYKINTTGVLNETTLGSSVVNSSLTVVGTLNAGGISSGFGAIDTGASNIITTGTIGASGAAIADGVTGTTQSPLDNSTKLATTAYVDDAVATVDTWAEVLALGNTSGATDAIITAGQKITTDTIDETTGAAGVTIDGVVLKDSDIIIRDLGYIGSASDTDAIQIEADGDVVLTQDLTLNSGNLLLNGGILYTDDIQEDDTGVGVTVDGVLIKDIRIQEIDAIHRSANDDFLTIAGGNAVNAGGSIDLYGGAHATAAGDIYFSTGGVAKLYFDASVPSWYTDQPISTTSNIRLNGGILYTDTIDEDDSNSGVTIDGTLIKDGVVTANLTGDVTGNADTVTNATLTTALTVDTGTLTLTANVADNSVLTIGAGASSISGANTGDQTNIQAISDTKANFDTACSDGNFMYDGDAPTAHAASHLVGAADTIFPADPGSDKFLMWDDDPGALVWADAGAGSGATTALDNLASVQINTTLVSDTDITDDLGTGDVRWKDTWFATLSSGLTAADTLKLRGRDVDGSAYVDILTITSNNTVTADLNAITTIGTNAILDVTSTTSALTTVGALDAGSITSGFGTISTGDAISGALITTTAGYALADTNYIGITGNELLTFNSAGTINVSGADLIVDDGNGMVIGHSALVYAAGETYEAQILGTAVPDASLLLGAWSADIIASSLRYFKSRNATIGSNTIVQDNDQLGSQTYYGDDGVDNDTLVAYTLVEVDDASPAAGDIGGAFTWNQADGAGGAARETMRLGADATLTVEDGTNTKYPAQNRVWLPFGNSISGITGDVYLRSGNGVMTTTKGQVMMRGGSVTGVSAQITVNSYTPVATAEIEVKINNTVVFSATETISGTGQVAWQDTQAEYTDTFSAGDILTLRIGVTGTINYSYPFGMVELILDT